MTPTDVRDMDLPESFHRLKRTVMLLSAAFLVLGIATPAHQTTLQMTWINIDIGTGWVRFLLWSASAYYLVGFGFEASNARYRNSQFLSGQTLQDVDAAFSGLSASVITLRDSADRLSKRIDKAAPDQIRERLDALHQTAIQWSSSMMAEIDRVIDECLSHELTSSSEELKSRIRSAIRYVRGATSEVLPPALKDIDDQLASDRDSVKHVEGLVESTESVVESAHREMKRLARGIGWARSASFWWWEIAGAVGFFFIASVVGWWPILSQYELR